MPIEIRELVIRATIDPAGGDAGGSMGPSNAGGCGAGPDPGVSGLGPGLGRDAASSADTALVQACVREVMRILERRAER